jgi:hypothetical protein
MGCRFWMILYLAARGPNKLIGDTHIPSLSLRSVVRGIL